MREALIVVSIIVGLPLAGCSRPMAGTDAPSADAVTSAGTVCRSE